MPVRALRPQWQLRGVPFPLALKTMNAREGIKTQLLSCRRLEHARLKTMNAREGIKT